MGQKIPAKEKYHILTVHFLSAHNAKELSPIKKQNRFFPKMNQEKYVLSALFKKEMELSYFLIT